MPRFSLRDLFWLTLVVALILGWWLEHHSITPIRERNRVLEQWLTMAKNIGFTFRHEEDRKGDEFMVESSVPD